MLSQKNSIAGTHINPEERSFENPVGEYHISYLPLAHLYEQIVVWIHFRAGVSIGFYSGDPLKLLEDVQELKPSAFASVPRLFNRIYSKVMDGVA